MLIMLKTKKIVPFQNEYKRRFIVRVLTILAFLIAFFSWSNVFAKESPNNVRFAAKEGISRNSGVAPLSVHFNADFNYSTSTERNFHHYDYTWNFGDSSSGNWGTTAKSKNIAKGPVAAHVYETPGTYTATLTVKDSADIVDTETFTILVSDPDVVYSGTNTTCISDTAHNDFSGCPSGASTISTNNIAQISSYLGSGRRVLLHRGSSWSSSAINAPGSSGPVTIGAYGNCSNPNELGICSNAPVISVANDGSSGSFLDLQDKQDWRIQDISFSGTSSAGLFGGVDDFQRILFLRLNIDGFTCGIGWSHWNDSTIMPIDQMVLASCNVINSGEYVAYIGSERLAVLGNNFSHSGTSHLVRVWQAYLSVIEHNVFSSANLDNLNGRLALKLHGPGDENGGDHEHCTPSNGNYCLAKRTEFTVISDNVFGSSGPWPVFIGPQDAAADERLSDIIFERNLFSRDFGTNNRNVSRPLHICARYVTLRNNIIDGSNADPDFIGVLVERYGPEPAPAGIEIYNNTIYRYDSVNDSNIGISISSNCSDVITINNLVSFPNVTSYVTAVSDSSSGVTSNNLLTNNPNFKDPNNSDPLQRDFSLNVGSPAINQGTTVPVFDDYAGNTRTGTYDIGAYLK